MKKALFSRSQKRSHGRAESAPHSVPGLALDFVFFLSARLNRELLKSNDDGDVKRIGTLRSNDADGNENVKKNNWFNKQNNNFARASRFFVHFFPVFARLRRENA